MLSQNKNIGTGSGAYELKDECARTSALITRTRTSTDILFCNNVDRQCWLLLG